MKKDAKLIFTKCERFKIYLNALITMRTALDEPKPDYRFGLCHAIIRGLDDALNIDVDGEDSDVYKYVDPIYHMEQYPEIYKHKPKKVDHRDNPYWFDLSKRGIRKRIKILEGAINELASSVES